MMDEKVRATKLQATHNEQRTISQVIIPRSSVSLVSSATSASASALLQLLFSDTIAITLLLDAVTAVTGEPVPEPEPVPERNDSVS
jgi:hypothetical protein